MVNWGAAVPVIVAIIGISGVILPAFSTPLINQIYNKPNLDINIDGYEKGKQIIIISNSGTMPATNLSLILTANNKIINNITNLFSTVNVTLAIPRSHSLLEIGSPMQINSSFVELHVKKFVNGGGSIIRLVVVTNDAIYTDYTVYATYDQGSKNRTGGQIDYLSRFLSVAGPIIYLLVAEFIVFIYLRILFSKRKRRRFYDGITQEIMDVRKGFKENLSNKEIFSDKYWTIRYPLSERLTPLPTGDKRRMISRANDYTHIDDFYSKLAERNSYIENTKENNRLIDNIVLLKLNKKCLDLAEELLEKIDWSVYIK